MTKPATDHTSESSVLTAETRGIPGRPQLTLEGARALVAEHFGIQGSISELPSDRDQNFLVTTGDGIRYVFKISNADEDPSVLEAQEQALQHLRAHDIPVQAVMPTISKDIIAHIELPSGTHLARLVTYLDGTLLGNIRPKTENILRHLGEVIGHMDGALSTFRHAAAVRNFNWDIVNAAEAIKEYSPMVKDARRRQLLEDFQERFESTVLPLLSDLPHQVIHGDANDYNVLVSKFVQSDNMGNGQPWARYISGVIDFGDLIYTVRIAELAICASYAMTGTENPIAALEVIAAGYHRMNPLSESEINVLFDLVRARLCMSVAFSAKQKRDEPDNDYLTISEKPSWQLLEVLAPYSTELATCCIRAACGFEPFPGNADLINWLKKQRKSFHAVVHPDPRNCPIHVFDFSVGTLDWKPADMMEPQSAGERLFDYLNENDADIGIGRYDEARLVYGGDQYEEFGSERRTIHIGLDIFQKPGAPIFAPLAGKVFSVENNAARFDFGPVVVLEHAPEDGPIFFTLYGHLSIESVKNIKTGQQIGAGEQIGCIGASNENGGWVPHLHLQIIGDMLDSAGDYIGVASASQRAVFRSLCPDPNLLVGIPESVFPVAPLTLPEIKKKRSAFIGPSLILSYDKPLHFVRGYKQFLYDPDGAAYLDAVNNVPHVGHSHPRVVEAASRQLSALNTNTRYLHENLVVYAERLAATMPEPLNVVFLVNSGSEANDLALRLAHAATGGTDIITVEGAYHGNLSSLIQISPYKYGGPGGEGAPVTTIPVTMPDPYRGPYDGTSGEVGSAYARIVEDAAGKSNNLSAFICESALGCGGQIFLPDTYLERTFAAVRAQGGVCITDEVQVGMGRLGSQFWGFQTHNVIPDIVTVGKPVGNGFPLGAVVTTRKIATAFNNGMEYFNTFGGNPVSCAVGLAVLDVIKDERLQENAAKVGAHLLRGLKSLAEQHPVIGDVRGQGLFLGVEFVHDPETLEPAAVEASYLVNRLREEHILTSTDGPLKNVLKIKPPLVFTVENAEQLLSKMAVILSEDYLHE